MAHHAEAQAVTNINRLRDIADPGVKHTWLWALNPNHGPTLHPGEYVDAVRLRLGAAGPHEPTPCSRCGRTLDTAGSHCLLCATGPATRGHNLVTGQVHELAAVTDPSAEREAIGLIPSHPLLRPADILTTATASGRTTAFDVSITSPDNGAAGDDCCKRCMRPNKPDTLHTLPNSNVMGLTTFPSCGAHSEGLMQPRSPLYAPWLAKPRDDEGTKTRRASKPARCTAYPWRYGAATRPWCATAGTGRLTTRSTTATDT
jgi:hypothetical protein